MKHGDISPQEAIKQIQKIFKERGTKALEIARKEVLRERIESTEVRDALTYFMTQYWLDTARPTLLSLACEAVGGDPNTTTPIAVPMILINGAIDIHDDIIDQSRRKEDHLTVYGKFGKDVALLVGDALLFKGFTLLHETKARIPAEKITPIMETFKSTFFELGDAEALEFQLRGRLDVKPEEYLHVAKKKAANVKAHTRIGAILGGGTTTEIEALSRIGTHLGVLLIVQDDFMDMLDFEESQHRIRFECAPLPLLYALQNPKISENIAKVLKKKMKRNEWETLVSKAYQTEEAKDLRKTIRKWVKDAQSELRNLKFGIEPLRMLITSVYAAIELAESTATNKP